jgi:hypothetical protein
MRIRWPYELSLYLKWLLQFGNNMSLKNNYKNGQNNAIMNWNKEPNIVGNASESMSMTCKHISQGKHERNWGEKSEL